MKARIATYAPLPYRYVKVYCKHCNERRETNQSPSAPAAAPSPSHLPALPATPSRLPHTAGRAVLDFSITWIWILDVWLMDFFESTGDKLT